MEISTNTTKIQTQVNTATSSQNSSSSTSPSSSVVATTPLSNIFAKKCNQCDFIARSKIEMYTHALKHMSESDKARAKPFKN